MKQKDPIWNFFAVVEQDNKTVPVASTVKQLFVPKLHDFVPIERNV